MSCGLVARVVFCRASPVTVSMNCTLCVDKKFLCETCSQLTPWPCPMEHDCYMPCPQCNCEGEQPGDESTWRNTLRERD